MVDTSDAPTVVLNSTQISAWWHLSLISTVAIVVMALALVAPYMWRCAKYVARRWFDLSSPAKTQPNISNQLAEFTAHIGAQISSLVESLDANTARQNQVVEDLATVIARLDAAERGIMRAYERAEAAEKVAGASQGALDRAIPAPRSAM